MLRLIVCVLFLITCTFGGSWMADESPQSSTEIITCYLSALADTLHGEASEETIDRVLAFYGEDIRYEHSRVGMVIEGKDRVRAGMLSFRGSYAGTAKDATIEVLDTLTAHNTVVVHARVHFLTKPREPDQAVQTVERMQLLVFELEGGKIRRVIDYW